MKDDVVTRRLAIVEDHGLIAHTLAAALRARGTEVEVLDPDASHDLVAEVAEREVDLVLLDLDLGSGIRTEDLVAGIAPDTAVLIVTGTGDTVRHAECVRAGAAGVVSKSIGFEALLAAVAQVLEHGTLLTKHERDELLARLRAEEQDHARQLAPFAALTEREAEVLGLLMRGASVAQVASTSYVSVATVRSQVRAILRKLEVPSQVAALALGRQAGWVPPQEARGE